MKQYGLLFLTLFSYSLVMGECRSLVGQKAPEFKAEAVVEGQVKEISLDDFKGKNKILIFYPADFSFVCPTELFALQEKITEFEKRNTVVIAFSVDQIYSHVAWLKKPRKEGGIQGITYPIVSDVTKNIARSYVTLDEEKGIDLRGIFILDEDNIIQALSVYNMSIGRDMNEIVRALDAMLFTKQHGQVCPANWQKGQEAITPTQEGLQEYLKRKELQ